MNQSQAIQDVLIGSAITVVTLWLLQALDIISLFCEPAICIHNGWLPLLTAQIIVYLLAGVPGIIFMTYRKVPNATLMAVLAVIEAFWFAYAFSILLTPSNYWIWFIAKALLFIPSFWLAFLYFNKWEAPLLHKLVFAFILMLATALLSDRLLFLL